MKDEVIAVAFGARLREARVRAGLTQAQLGALTDPVMQSQAIARYESGDRTPTLALLYRLASAMGTSPTHLLPHMPRLKPARKPPTAPSAGERSR